MIGELINYIQGELSESQIENLWVNPVNEKVERVYAKAGFVTVAKGKMYHAVRESL